MKLALPDFGSFEPTGDGFRRRDWTPAELPPNWLDRSVRLASRRRASKSASERSTAHKDKGPLHWLPEWSRRGSPALAVQYNEEVPLEVQYPVGLTSLAREIAVRLFPDAEPETLTDEAQRSRLFSPDRFMVRSRAGILSHSVVVRDSARAARFSDNSSGYLFGAYRDSAAAAGFAYGYGEQIADQCEGLPSAASRVGVAERIAEQCRGLKSTPYREDAARIVQRVRAFQGLVSLSAPCVVSVLTRHADITMVAELSPVWAALAVGILVT